MISLYEKDFLLKGKDANTGWNEEEITINN